MHKFQPQTQKTSVEIVARNIRPGHIVLINRARHLVSEVQFDLGVSHFPEALRAGYGFGAAPRDTVAIVLGDMYLKVSPDEKLLVEANEGKVACGRELVSNVNRPVFVEHEGAPHYVVNAVRMLNLETMTLTKIDSARYYPLLEVVKT